MKSKVLAALGKTDGYVSGQEICDTLQVSRTAIWKVMNQLKEDGYEIEAVSRRGYRIVSRPDVITAEEVESRMDTKWLGRKICYYPVIDSTNNEVRRLAEQGVEEGLLVLAEEQNQGKGRRGRSWVTPAGSAIAMSFLLRPKIMPARASMLTLVMGLSVAYACRDFLNLDVHIKWPNDIVINGKKICGILTEMSSEIDYINYLVIGTGINTNIQEFPEELKDVAISLHELTGVKPDRAGLIAACMKQFETFYELFLKTQDLTHLQDAYNRLLISMNQKVRVLEPGNEYCGISEGINAMGELLVRKDDGSLEEVYAGEVSVRGIYGYV